MSTCHWDGSHQWLHPSNASYWALYPRKRRIPGISQPSDCSHSPRWVLKKRKLKIWKHRTLAPDCWGVYQRNDFSEPRVFSYNHKQKSAKFFNLECLFFVCFSVLIHKNTFDVQTTCLLLQSFDITWLLSLPPQSSSHRITWNILSHTCTPVFITALFIIARTWKKPRCPSADKRIRKLWYIYTMEYYSAIKKNTFESVLMRWMKLEPIIQSEVSQKEKHWYSLIMHIYGI